MLKYEAVQKSADEFVNELTSLPEDERKQWLSYLFEVMEAFYMDTGLLEDSKELIENRLEQGSW